MKNLILKHILSISLAGAIAAAAIPAAAEGEIKTATVSATFTDGSSFIINEQALTVSSDEAEKFGYDDKLTDGVSSLDVLVKMHEINFGEAFTPETASQYFSMSDAGWITRVMDVSTSPGYALNHGSTYNLYGEIADGGSFELYFYSDLTNWSDIYCHLPDIAAVAGVETVINAQYYDYTLGNLPMKGAQLAYVNGSDIELIKGASADDEGNIKITFDKPGTYYVTLAGTYNHEVTVDWNTGETAFVDSPIIPSVTKVTVGLSDDVAMPDEAYKATAETIKARTLEYGKEWEVLGLARAGYEIPDTYFESVEGRIGTLTKATDIERTIIALTAAGKRADSALVNKLSSDDFTNVNGGLFSSVYALIALNMTDRAVPFNRDADDRNTREKMINNVLKYQMPDGGFALTSVYGADVDTTAMAVQGLARYKDREDVAESISKALVYIDNNLYAEKEYTPDTCSSLAQVITAYTELGKDPGSYVKKMLEYYDGSGNFLYNGSANSISTTQAFYALAAYYRWAKGESSLYDMTGEQYGISGYDSENVVIYSPFDGKAAVIGASYQNGVLTDTMSKTVMLKKGDNTVNMPGFDKIMLWSADSGIQPLCGEFVK